MITTQMKAFSFESAQSVFFTIVQILGASLFLAFCSQISIPLYFTPVPFSGQTFGIMLIGATMGSHKGLLSVLAYLAEGSLGLPVFACGGSGLMSLFGPTGGYFLGFIFQVYLVGSFVERQVGFQSTKILMFLLLSCALQLGLGVLWLSRFVGFESAIIMGLCPFFLGETIKALCISGYLRTQNS